MTKRQNDPVKSASYNITPALGAFYDIQINLNKIVII